MNNSYQAWLLGCRKCKRAWKLGVPQTWKRARLNINYFNKGWSILFYFWAISFTLFFFFWEFKCNCCTDMLHNFKSSHRLPPWLPKSIQHVRFIYHLFKFACSCNQIVVGFPLPLILENWYDKKLFPLYIVREAPKVWLL